MIIDNLPFMIGFVVGFMIGIVNLIIKKNKNAKKDYYREYLIKKLNDTN